MQLPTKLIIDKTLFSLRGFPFICIFLAPFIDMLNGYIQNTLRMFSPIGLLFRGLLIIYTFPFIIKLRKTFFGKLVIVVLVFYLFALPLWLMAEEHLVIGEDLVYFIRIVFYYCIVSYFWYYRYEFNVKYLAGLGNKAALVSAISLLLCAFTGLGSATYSFGDIRAGTRGFFTAGNDVGLFMNICLVVTIVNLIYFNKFRQFIIILITYAGNLVIASRVGIAGSSLIMLLFLIFLFFNGLPKLRIKRLFISLTKLIFILLIVGLVITTIRFISEDAYLLERFTSDSSTNPRESLMEAGKISIEKFSPLQFCIGRSATGSMSMISKTVGLFDGNNKAVEAELHDTISSYGFILGSLIIITYLVPFFYSLKIYLAQRTYPRFWNLIAVSLFWGIAIIAGHAFTNAMVFPLMCYIFIIALRYNEVDSRESVKCRSRLPFP